MLMRFVSIVALWALGACTSTPIDVDEQAYATRQTQITFPRDPHRDPYRIVDNFVLLIDPEITAMCRDGWISYSENRDQTCVGHHGVREWRHRPSENVVGRVISSRAVSVFVGDVEVEATLVELQQMGLHQRVVRFLSMQDDCALGEAGELLFRVTLEQEQIHYAQHANEAPYEPTDLVAIACGPVVQ